MILKKLNSRGNSLIQVVIAAGIMTTVMLASMDFFSNQTKSNNFLEFQAKREQLRLSLLGQFLNNPDNCACLFNGAAEFPATGTAELIGVVPTTIGRYSFVTPGVCATSTIPYPFINSDGVDGMRAASIGIRNIINVAGNYSGELTIGLVATKRVLGPSELPLKIPIAINVSPGTPGNVVFSNCSTGSSGGSAPLGVCTGGLVSIGYDPLTGNLVCQPPIYQ
ncbi:MAG: hypothetical protein AABZ31_03785 [Bdellovibrionota bacterium]